MVFAAGRGVRMGPLTARRAKPSLPFVGTPLLTRILERLRSAGVREVVVNLHHAPGSLEPLLAFVEAGAGGGFRIHRSVEPDLLGTSGGLHRVREHFAGGAFFVLNADTLHTVDLAGLAAEHAAAGEEATLVADPDPPPQLRSERRLGNARGRFTGLTEPDSGDPVFSGVWVLEPAALRHLSGRPIGLSQDLLPGLAAVGAARVFESRSPWFEVGTPRRYLEASLEALATGAVRPGPDRDAVLGPGARAAPRELLGPGCRLAAGARVERSVLAERVEVGAGAVVEDCVVGPDERIPAGTRIEGALFAGGESTPL